MKKLTVTVLKEETDHYRTGLNMRALRIAAGLSLRELGAEMGVSPAYLSDLELGRRKWSEAKAKEYAETIRGISRK